MDSPKKLEDISPEVLVEAIKYVEKARDRVALTGVSRYFKMLAGDPKAWKGERTLVMGEDVPVEYACGLVRKFSPGLKSVSFSYRHPFRKADEDPGIRFLETLKQDMVKVKRLTLRSANTKSNDSLQFRRAKLLDYAAFNQELESLAVFGHCLMLLLGFGLGNNRISNSVKEFVCDETILWPEAVKVYSSRLFSNHSFICGFFNFHQPLTLFGLQQL